MLPFAAHRSQDSRLSLVTLAAAGALLLLALTAAPAGASQGYEESLSVTQNGPAVVGQVVNFTASGQQPDVEQHAGGFALQVYAKVASADPTCAPSAMGENSTWGSDFANESHPVVGLWEGPGTSFSVPFKVLFERPGRMLLCAYSEWVTDTAATAQLTVEVAPGAAPAGAAPAPPAPTVSSGGSSIPPPPAVLTNTKRPRVTRAHNKLACAVGSWLGAPTNYAYAWLVNGRLQTGAHRSALRVTRAVIGRRVQCRVTASNAGAHAVALSAAYHVH